ncbi:hypothetical protein BJY04DRAFT_220277 [Aspergillus karnatakaensis]|uniref:uncharacterized protein n=1 Tax=Aspergillus karnatakaensis TaxID=1810916 RepID=UPI003CCC9704
MKSLQLLVLLLVLAGLPSGVLAQELDCHKNSTPSSRDHTICSGNSPATTGLELTTPTPTPTPLPSLPQIQYGLLERSYYLTAEEFNERFGTGSSSSKSKLEGAKKIPKAVIILLPALVGVSSVAGIGIFALWKSRKIVRRREAEAAAAAASFATSRAAQMQQRSYDYDVEARPVGHQVFQSPGLSGNVGGRGGDVLDVPPPAYSREPVRY